MTAITPEELRGLFLFESLDDDQLEWLARHGRVESFPAGTHAVAEGQPAESFIVLLDGELAMSRQVRGDEVEISRTSQRGVYAGATQAWISDAGAVSVYPSSIRAVTDCRFLVLPAAEFGPALREWFPMAVHLLEGLYHGMRTTDALISQRERLVALGSLSAGLMHELNNPAAATARATSALRERLAHMRHKLAMLADGSIDRTQLRNLVELQEVVIARLKNAVELTPMQAADREDELADWLAEHAVRDGWDLAPVLTAAGMDVDCLDEIADKVDPSLLEQSIRWLGYTLETEMLMSEVEDASARISALVGAAKQYSQMDRAAHQWTDVHEGLKSTLAVMRHKLGDGITIVKELDPDLPRVPAYPAELNQVWTNIIDNAAQAMEGRGTLTVRTSHTDTSVLVDIGDSGPGMSEEVRRRIFEPFFTTKPVGQGTGLGLDISYRIVVNRHGGDITVTSHPGDTHFVVRLPMTGTTESGT
ncbi:sensor histidine kinase [Luedemannella helvata]|uniref:histidine kinase n=1 Tax=Luedemannella helvata TaxID=349315 RepID=A0ABP4WT02_9ACTN